jgi:predicted nuclease of predicted toxin-antitoxin system
MKFIVDMNLTPKWVRELAGNGWEARHWASIGQSNAADIHIIDYARANHCVIVTQDLDFGTILSESGSHKPSVVQIRAKDTSPETIGPRVIAAIFGATQELSAGAFLSIDPVRSRLRVLPMTPRLH